MKKFILVLGVVVMALAVEALEFSCKFGKGEWKNDDFVMVKGPRWSKVGSWEQKADHIVQKVPAGATEEDLYRRMHDEAYVAMCYGKKVKLHKKVVCSSTMSFDYRMAPLIVIAPKLGVHEASGAPEFREHFEIVLYDKGINVWNHMWKDGKPYWVKHSYIMADFKKDTRYELTAVITSTSKGQMLEVRCGDVEFGCYLPGLGKEFYLGIIGCEGRNRFYDFKISAPHPDDKD